MTIDLAKLKADVADYPFGNLFMIFDTESCDGIDHEIEVEIVERPSGKYPFTAATVRYAMRALLLPDLEAAYIAQAAEIERLRGVMQAIVDGDYPMPVAQAFRSDEAWSKHDRCAHGNRISDGCENCVDVFLTAALGEQP